MARTVDKERPVAPVLKVSMGSQAWRGLTAKMGSTVVLGVQVLTAPKVRQVRMVLLDALVRLG